MMIQATTNGAKCQYYHDILPNTEKRYQKMIEMKRGGKLCCITPNEYTSTRNKRYMNTNLHYNSEHANLGMASIKGSMPAERVDDLMKERLHDLGLKMEKHTQAQLNTELKLILDSKMEQYFQR